MNYFIIVNLPGYNWMLKTLRAIVTMIFSYILDVLNFTF